MSSWLDVTERGLRVKRLHTIPTLFTETVGEHTVQMMRLVVHLQSMNSDCSLEKCLLHALQHDVAEAYTGDIPASFKQDNPEAVEPIKAAEERWEARNLVPHEPLSWREAALCKLADWLQLQEKCLYERAAGNRHIDPVWGNITQYLRGHPGMTSIEGAMSVFTTNVERWLTLTTS